jgi:hypothetical protein
MSRMIQLRPRLVPTIVLLLTFAVGARAQQAEPAAPMRGPGASFGGAFTTGTGATGTTGGVVARLTELRPRGVGLELGLVYLVSSATHSVFPGYSAAFADLGAVYAVPRGASAVLLRSGGSFVLNGNGSGDLAPYLGVGLITPISDRLGARFDAMGRYWIAGPGLGVGAEAGLVWFLTSRAGIGAPESPRRSTETARQPDGWSFGGGVNLIASTTENLDGLLGPHVQVARLAPGRLGFEAGLTYITPAGRYDFTGLALDLGLAYGQPIGTRPLLLLRGGLTMLVGGDNDGGGGAAAALTPGVGLVVPLAGRLGLRFDVSPRIWFGEFAPTTFGASAAMVLLPR